MATRANRWGDNTPADEAAARELLLDAAEDCFRRFGILKTTIDDIAAAAHVSRRTVYYYFEGRDAILLGVFLRDVESLFQESLRVMGAQKSFADAIIEGTLFVLNHIRDYDRLATLFDADAAALTSRLAGASDAFFAISLDAMRPFLEDARDRGELRPGLDPRDVSEFLLRMLFSLLAVDSPVPRDDSARRVFLRTFMLPPLVVDPPRARSSFASSARSRKR